MRDAEETCHFRFGKRRRITGRATQDSAIGSDSFSTNYAENIAAAGAIAQHRFQTFFATRRKVSGRNSKRGFCIAFERAACRWVSTLFLLSCGATHIALIRRFSVSSAWEFPSRLTA
jgi:hypothetical protein